MEPSQPGIGRGGRGAGLLQLLQNRNTQNNNQRPRPSIGRGIFLSSDAPSQGSSGSGLSKPTVTVGRGRAFQFATKTPGQDVPSLARGRGMIFQKNNSEASVTESFQPVTPAEQSSEVTHHGTNGFARDHTMNGFSKDRATNGVSKDHVASSSSEDESTSRITETMKRLAIAAKEREVVSYHGNCGQPTSVNVNCVRVKCMNEGVFQYYVHFTPELDSKNMRFFMLKQHKEVIGATKTFDGTILYLPKPLPQNETRLKSMRFTDNTEVSIKIIFTQKIDPASHLLIPFYNNLLRRTMQSMNMCSVGRNFYDPQSARTLERLRINLWPGYVTAIKRFEGGLLLNLDVSHKVLRSDTAKTVMEELFHRDNQHFQENCLKELVGTVVLTRYNNKNYRIDDIAWNLNPLCSFTTAKGDKITFKEYYKVQYKIDIQNDTQPLLVHRPKRITQRDARQKQGEDREICLVPELCYMTGLSDRMRTNFSAMKQIKEHTCLPPAERNKSIEQFLRRLNSTPAAKEEFLKWGFEIEQTTTIVDARICKAEKVLFGNGHIETDSTADFGREVGRMSVITPVKLRNWLLFCTRRDAHKARNFFQKLMEVSRKLGIEVNQPTVFTLGDDRSTTYKDAISSAINPQVQLVVCIFPTSRDDRYNALKKLCCLDMPVPSQVILSKTLPEDFRAGKFRSVTLKIALQINCKLGGELWGVEIPLRGLMVCGIDVYHDSGGRGRSVAAFVASTNSRITRWYSRAILQQPHQEVIDGLKHCFIESIKKYYEVNNALPERIVIYRDGVGDGQLSHVSEHEMPQMESCFQMFNNIIGAEYKPKLSVVIVSKRINIRYFRSGCLENPAPGTVVDHTVTRPNWPDFFLVSQHVRQGTVSPTHYIVVYGQEHLSPDHMQRLSYKMTHMYYNWPGTVRVPAPCQYAHKLAYLVGQNIRAEPSLKLCDRLFYL